MSYTNRNKLVESLCGIGLMLLLIFVFYGIVNDAYTVYNHSFESVTNGVQIVGAFFLAIAIIILVRSYRKDNGTLAVNGAEFLVLAILTALLPGAFLSFPKPFNMLAKLFPYIFLVYYIFKMIFVIKNSINGQKKQKKRG